MEDSATYQIVCAIEYPKEVLKRETNLHHRRQLNMKSLASERQNHRSCASKLQRKRIHRHLAIATGQTTQKPHFLSYKNSRVKMVFKLHRIVVKT